MPPRDPYLSTTSRGTVHGPLLRARDIHDAALAPPPAPGRPEVRLDPPRTTTAVRGRTRLLGELIAAMDTGAPVPHVLAGPDGVGTSTVAAALAERAEADGRRVFWLRAGEGRVWQQLDHSPEPWLLVLDGADRTESLDPYRSRSGPGGFVLVTSRVHDAAVWSPARVHTVTELDSAAAGAALADHAGEEALPGAEELAERLGGVPLALTLAGRILAAHRVLFPDARALCKRLDEDGLAPPDTLSEPFGCQGRALLSGIWDVALDLVSRREPKAPALLRLLAVLGSEGAPVPLGRLDPRFLRGEPLPLNDRPELARSVNALVVHGLVSVGNSGEAIDLRLHPLVSQTLRAQRERCAPFQALAERILAGQS